LTALFAWMLFTLGRLGRRLFRGDRPPASEIAA
jgi:hypothetical protein